MIQVPKQWNESTMAFWRFTASLATDAQGGPARAVCGALSRSALLRADKPATEVWSALSTELRACALAASATSRGDAYRRELVRTLVLPWWHTAIAHCTSADVSASRDLLATLSSVLSWTAGRSQREIADWRRESEFCDEASETSGTEDGLEDPQTRIWAAARSACALVAAILGGKSAVAGAHAADLCYRSHVDLSGYSLADVEHAYDFRAVALRELCAAGMSATVAEQYLDATGDPLSALFWWQQRTSVTRVAALREQGTLDFITRDRTFASFDMEAPRMPCTVLCDGGTTQFTASSPWALIDMMDEAIITLLRADRIGRQAEEKRERTPMAKPIEPKFDAAPTKRLVH